MSKQTRDYFRRLRATDVVREKRAEERSRVPKAGDYLNP